LIGASRKRFIAAIDERAQNAAKDRLGGSVAAALLAAQQGADMVRVHDVAETVQALKLWRAVEQS
jgi:dihydropteroate synthase